MKRRHRVYPAVMLTMTLAACSSNPTAPGPESVRPSLLVVGTVEATGLVDVAHRSCGVPTDGGGLVISGSSTYIVAYGETPPDCGAGTTGVPQHSCGATTDDGGLVISGNSTYIVAYGDKQPDCGAAALDTTSAWPAAEPLAPPPAPRLDTLSLKLSF